MGFVDAAADEDFRAIWASVVRVETGSEKPETGKEPGGPFLKNFI